MGDKIGAGHAGVLLEHRHKVGFAVTDGGSQIFQPEGLAIVVVDMVDDLTDFLILAVGIVGLLAVDMAVAVEQVDEPGHLALEQELKVPALFLGRLDNAADAGGNFLITSIPLPQVGGKLDCISLQGLDMADRGLVQAGGCDHIQMAEKTVQQVGFCPNGVDRVHGVGTDEDNVPSSAIEIIGIDMITGRARLDVVDLHLGVPVKKDVGVAVLDPNGLQLVGDEGVVVGHLMAEFLVSQEGFHGSSIAQSRAQIIR